MTYCVKIWRSQSFQTIVHKNSYLNWNQLQDNKDQLESLGDCGCWRGRRDFDWHGDFDPMGQYPKLNENHHLSVQSWHIVLIIFWGKTFWRAKIGLPPKNDIITFGLIFFVELKEKSNTFWLLYTIYKIHQQFAKLRVFRTPWSKEIKLSGFFKWACGPKWQEKNPNYKTIPSNYQEWHHNL